MKTEYEKVYEYLYDLPVEDFFKSSAKVQESFVFQGSGNWDMYCTKKNKKFESYPYQNVELIGFSTLEEVNSYDIPKNQIIDFSREHFSEAGVEKYFLLVQR
ncbi:MAG: hypothetical protein ACQERD_12365 [Campylobacterota bacterium]